MKVITAITVTLSYVASILISICLIVICAEYLKSEYGQNFKNFRTRIMAKIRPRQSKTNGSFTENGFKTEGTV